MRYVALLRGINVGGKNKVDMKQLKAVFEQAGMTNVSTYINSGNVLFETDVESRHEITAKLERAIEIAFGFFVKVLVKSQNDIAIIAAALPATWLNDLTMKCDVMFLWEVIDDVSIVEKVAINPEVDRVKYVPGALLWSVDRKHATKSGVLKLVGTNTYAHITIRNCNTLRKLAAKLS